MDDSNENVGNHENSAFRDVREEMDDDDEFMQDPQDFTNVTGRAERRKKLKYAGLVVFALLAIVAIVIAGKYIKDVIADGSEAEPTPTVTAPKKTEPAKVKTSEEVKPLLKGYKNAPKVVKSSEVARVTDKRAVSSEGALLRIVGGEIEGSVEPCDVVDPTDFCFAGYGTVEGADFDLYFVKDAAHSRLFENPKNFKKTTVAGSPSSGFMTLDLGKKDARVLVTVNRSSSGWMLVFNDSKLNEKAITDKLTTEK